MKVLIVGVGLYGAVMAQRAVAAGHDVTILEKRDHIGGNTYTYQDDGIIVHKYGAHIFHTNNMKVRDYLCEFTEFNNFINRPIAKYRGEEYSLPFNMNTFKQMWGVETAEEAERIISKQRTAAGISEPHNLEEQAIALVGTDIYEKLIKHYTAKQWGRDCDKLPASIIKRIPVRYTFDNNYYDALFQGIPKNGYTAMIQEMIKGAEVILGVDYLQDKEYYNNKYDLVIYTGQIDAYYNYEYGRLSYRSLRFEIQKLDIADYQGNAVVNYTDAETDYTRITEHKWFTFGKNTKGEDISNTVISKEYSTEWQVGSEPYYPVNDEYNNALYERYRLKSNKESKVIFGGRLAEYIYYDMDSVTDAALRRADTVF